MWNSIYDYVVQLFAGLRWSAFVAQNNDNILIASKLKNVFRNDLYSISGWFALSASILSVYIYYFLINRKGGAGYAFKTKYWFFTLLSTSILVAVTMLFISVKMTSGYSSINPFKYNLALAFTNLLYTAILFFLFSLIVKRRSVANTTPF